MVIKVPAKVNLRLEIKSIREDGYHELAMVNSRVSLFDIITITEDKENKVIFSIDELNNISNNICLNLLNDMCNIYNIRKRYSIYIEKHIPQGAGLGGGSCDAAAILNFIDKDCELKLSLEEKINLGVKYGADVPYCLIDDVAYVEGIGEKITLFNCDIDENIYLICPRYFTSTKESFNLSKQSNNILTFDEIRHYIKTRDYKSLFYNGLEEATFLINPRLKEIKEILSNFGCVTMSGSGSSFILIENKKPSFETLTDCDIYHVKLGKML